MKKIVVGCVYMDTRTKKCESDIVVFDKSESLLHRKGDELTHIWNTSARICEKIARCKGFNNSEIMCMTECDEENISSETLSMRSELDFYFDSFRSRYST